MGATHYTHWFHPLTEGTAEKHDAFVEHDGKGGVMGGIHRQTARAAGTRRIQFSERRYPQYVRGTWLLGMGPLLPGIIVDDTLCIPTIFIAYTGESLDYKAPLLKACVP